MALLLAVKYGKTSLLPLALLLAACGGGNPVEDDIVDAAVPADAAPPSCDPTAPFGAPTLVDGLPTGARGVHLTDDERTAYFAMTNVATPGVYAAHRDDRSSAFGAPRLVLDPHGTALIMSADVAPDEQSILVGAYTADEHIYRATRASSDAEFGDMVQVSGANHVSEYDEQPFLSHDGTTLWFSTSHSNGGPMTIDTSAANGDGFDEPTEITGLGDPNMFWPVISPDDLTLYFLRAENVDELITTHRDSPTAPWGPLNSLAHMGLPGTYTAPTWISLDQCRLYVYTVTDEQGGGTEKAYVAERSPS